MRSGRACALWNDLVARFLRLVIQHFRREAGCPDIEAVRMSCSGNWTTEVMILMRLVAPATLIAICSGAGFIRMFIR